MKLDKESAIGYQMMMLAKMERESRVELRRNIMPNTSDMVEKAKRGGRPRADETVDDARKRRGLD